MRPHPANSVAAVSDILRPHAWLRLCTEHIVTADDDIASPREVSADARRTVLGLVTTGEAAAMDKDNRGAILPSRPVRQIEVELLLPLSRKEGQVAEAKDGVRHDRGKHLPLLGVSQTREIS